MEESVKTEQVNAYQYSPLALAYMGDSILDLLFVELGKKKSKEI